MKTLIYGHRGASGYAPENTLEAFQKAVDLKADGIELDIQLTKDQKIVVCHDETIDRTSNGTGYLRDYTLDELKQLNFNRTHPEYTFVQIPTMEEVFQLLKNTNLIINIELKTGIYFYEGIEEKIIQLTKEYGFDNRVIYSSFNHYSAKKIHALNPHAKVGFLYEDGPIDMPSYAYQHHANAIHPAWYNLQYDGVSTDARNLNLDINVWTVNTKEQVQLCLQNQVTGIITNYPDRVREYIKELECN